MKELACGMLTLLLFPGLSSAQSVIIHLKHEAMPSDERRRTWSA